jgi:hypothetical protein
LQGEELPEPAEALAMLDDEGGANLEAVTVVNKCVLGAAHVAISLAYALIRGVLWSAHTVVGWRWRNWRRPGHQLIPFACIAVRFRVSGTTKWSSAARRRSRKR